jgi:steroid delta-isomerase-like uncharacterized protein
MRVATDGQRALARQIVRKTNLEGVMASVEKMKEVLEKQLRAFSAGDWKTYRETISDRSVYEEEATGRRVTGADEVVRTVEPWLKGFPDCVGRIKDAIASGDAIVAELEWTGTQKGALTGPFGTIPPTNKQVRVPAVLVLRFEGERIREARHYFDLLSLLRQLGIAPQMGAAASR